MGKWTPLISLGLLLALWIVFTCLINLGDRLRDKDGYVSLARLGSLPRAYLGMNLAHFGVAVFIVGVTLVKGYESEQDVRMDIGDTVDAGGYTFRFDGTMPVTGPNYRSDMGIIRVLKGGKVVKEMNPEKRIYDVQNNPMTEAAIDSGLFRDLYVSLGEPVGNGAWSVRIYYKPTCVRTHSKKKACPDMAPRSAWSTHFLRTLV